MNKNIFAGLCALLVAAGAARAQSTAFAYQGRLNSATNAATGLYDFSFNLYATSNGGPALTASNAIVALPVTNGLFAVTLDFGNQFPGADRWLGIAVRTNESGNFVTLAPRQPLNPTPYAIRAASAGTALTATTATTANSVAAGAVNGTALAGSAVDSSKIADGSIAAGDLSPTLLSNTFWRLTGNVGTSPGANFVGTTDNQALDIRVNNVRVLRLEPTGFGIPNVVGGAANSTVVAGAFGAAIAGGESHTVGGAYPAIGGGYLNTATNTQSVVAGGAANVAGGYRSAVGGGEGNVTGGRYSTVPGGQANSASGDYSFAAGRRAKAVHQGALVLADSQDANFASTSSDQFLVRASGGMGIGTATPRGALEVNTGAGSFVFRNEIGAVPSLSIADSPNAGVLRFRNRFEIWPNDAGTASGTLDVRNSTGTLTVNLPGSGDGYFTAGKFGIGKTDPATALDVNGTVTASQFNGPLNGNLSGTFNGGVSASSFKLGSSSTAGSVLIASDGIGNVGFQSNLRVFDAVFSTDNGNIVGGRNNTLGAGIVGAVIAGGGTFLNPNQVSGSLGAIGGGSANSAGNLGTVPGGSANSAAGQYSFAAGRRAKANHQGTFVWADSQNSDFISTANNQFLIRALFGVGINTPSPVAGFSLDVNGTAQIRSALVVDGNGVNDGNINEGLVFGGTVSGEGIGSRRTSGNNQYGLDFYTGFSRRLSITNDGSLYIHNNPLYLRTPGDRNHGLAFRSSFAGQSMDGPALFGYANGVLGTTDSGERAALTWNREGDVNVTRNLSTCSLTIRGGCDVAEPFLMREEAIEPGSVVVIDEEHPGQLKLSAQAYDTRVAGIVSGAGGVKPGIALHQEGVLEGGKNVALTGRVYVKADATHGAIRPGDLLTTSERPGHAMKVTDPTRSQGAILGKAMCGLKDGTGLVLVLVTLQ